MIKFIIISYVFMQILIIAHPLNNHRHFHLTHKGLDLYIDDNVHVLDSSDDSYIGMVQLHSGFSSLILWDDKTLYYRSKLCKNNMPSFSFKICFALYFI